MLQSTLDKPFRKGVFQSVGATVSGCFEQQRVKIKRSVHHFQLALCIPGPFGLGAVSIDLDAVSVGIVEIDRFADAMICSAFDLDSGIKRRAERLRQRCAIGIEKCDME